MTLLRTNFRKSNDFISLFLNSFHLFTIFISSFLFLSFVISPADARQLFPVNRLHYYAVDDKKFGGTSPNLNCDITVYSKLKYQPRNCILVHLHELSVKILDDFIYKKIVGLVIIVPEQFDYIIKSLMREIEDYMMSINIPFPVAFLRYSANVKEMYDTVERNAHQVERNRLLYSLVGVSYRADIIEDNSHLTHVSQTKGGSKNYYDRLINKGAIKITNLQGFLKPFDPSKKTILLSASYDTFCFIENFSDGYESSSSATVLMMELMRILSTFFSKSDQNLKYNLIFLLNDGGKYNFYGTEKWITSKLKNSDGTILMDSIIQVINLESLIKNHNDHLNLHFSKLPIKDSFAQRLVDILTLSAGLHNSRINIVHKKIKLNKEMLDWGHERFAIHKISGVTLSTWPSVDINYLRHSCLDGLEHNEKELVNDAKLLSENVWIISETLIRLLLNTSLDEEYQFNNSTIISEKWSTPETMISLMNWISNQRREAHSLKYIDPKLADSEHISSAQFVNSVVNHMKLNGLHNIDVQSHLWDESVPKLVKNKKAESLSEDKGLENLLRQKNYNFNLPADKLFLSLSKLQTSFFDLGISCCILFYLFVLHYGLKIFLFVGDRIRMMVFEVKEKTI